MRNNPFFELYVGEVLSSNDFVTIFSPFLVEHAEALFLPGNVVVKGIQGSGKSMLLSLLRSDVRHAYAASGTRFPIPDQIAEYIGAGINLSHSNAIDFGYRSLDGDVTETALLFADFVNYTIILDLLDSIATLATTTGCGQAVPRIDLSIERERYFVSKLASTDIFHGTFQACRRICDIKKTIRSRINTYRRFLHMNDRNLDTTIRETKTDIGVPISVVATMLKRAQVIDDSVLILIHVDQYEELANIPTSETTSPDYRSVINRALARRDSTVSYRIGTRGHAWHNHGNIFGSTAQLEEERDYKYVDLDEMLRRHENVATWVFPAFAKDVFARRLRHAALATQGDDGGDLLDRVFGKGLTPKQKARKYGGRSPRRSVKTDKDWPDSVKKGLLLIADEDPLDARLLESWLLQQIGRQNSIGSPTTPSELHMGMLGKMQDRIWWKKERNELALVQIAGRCQQRPIWCGSVDIIDLSGGNILTFLSICQFIWDTHNMTIDTRTGSDILREIQVDVQAVGIFKASHYWLRKTLQETGRSGDRYRLARQIGTVLGRRLHSDRKLSYPGHNGFSLADDELERAPDVKGLLEEMSDYGTLIKLTHTTKERDRRSRHKFYLSPILCPLFKMQYKRLKEPRYIHPDKVERWMRNAGLSVDNPYRPLTTQRGNLLKRNADENLSLFDGGEDE